MMPMDVRVAMHLEDVLTLRGEREFCFGNMRVCFVTMVISLLALVQPVPAKVAVKGCPTVEKRYAMATLLPNPYDCTTFYICAHGDPVLFNCPANLHFNNKLKVCDYPENAHCFQLPSQRSLTEPEDGTNDDAVVDDVTEDTGATSEPDETEAGTPEQKSKPAGESDETDNPAPDSDSEVATPGAESEKAGTANNDEKPTAEPDQAPDTQEPESNPAEEPASDDKSEAAGEPVSESPAEHASEPESQSEAEPPVEPVDEPEAKVVAADDYYS